jgi:hypothetical protein
LLTRFAAISRLQYQQKQTRTLISVWPGTDVMILKIFLPKNGEQLAFLTQNEAKF